MLARREGMGIFSIHGAKSPAGKSSGYSFSTTRRRKSSTRCRVTRHGFDFFTSDARGVAESGRMK
jgi:hypothetical protein